MQFANIIKGKLGKSIGFWLLKAYLVHFKILINFGINFKFKSTRSNVWKIGFPEQQRSTSFHIPRFQSNRPPK